MTDSIRGRKHINRYTRFPRQHVGRAARNDSQRHSAVNHAVGHFVDRAVAARRQNEVATGLDLPLRLNRGATRPGGSH